MRQNRRRMLPIATLLTASLVVAVPILASPVVIDPHSYALVVDPCRTVSGDWARVSEVTLIDYLIENPDSDKVEEIVWWPTNSAPHGGATVGNLPSDPVPHIFATRGDKLDVYGGPFYDPGWQAAPVRTIDIGALVGLTGLELGRVTTGHLFGIEVEPGVVAPQTALYMIGVKPAEEAAYYIVIDQQWALDGTTPTGIALYGFGQICSAPTSCSILDALDIRVGDLGGTDFREEAYIATAQRFGTLDLQVTYRLERGFDGTTFTLTTPTGSLWHNADNPIDPPMMEDSSGLRFADQSHDIYVPRKSDWKVANLADGSVSCALPGEPTDIAVWEPGGSSSEPRYLLATTWDGSIGTVEVFPAGGCAGGTPSTLSVLVGAEPTSLDLYPVGPDQVWALVVSKGAQLFEAILLQFESPGGVDSFSVIDTATRSTLFTPFTTSCPSFVQSVSLDWVPTAPGNPNVDRNCLPNDPRCKKSPTPPPPPPTE